MYVIVLGVADNPTEFVRDTVALPELLFGIWSYSKSVSDAEKVQLVTPAARFLVSVRLPAVIFTV